MEGSKTVVLAALSTVTIIEVGAAAVVGLFAFNETLDVPHIIGIALVILSIILVNVSIRTLYRRMYGTYLKPVLDLAKFYTLLDTEEK